MSLRSIVGARRRPTALADEDLVTRVQTQDVGAFEVLYDRHSSQAYSLSLRILGTADAAEDVVQDAFLAVWKRVETYDPSRGSFRSWLLSIVHSRSIDRLRTRNAHARRQDALESEEQARPIETPVETQGEIGVLADDLRGDLAALPQEQREVIALAYYRGLTHREIAEYLELPIGTVKGRVRLAMKALRARVGVSENVG